RPAVRSSRAGRVPGPATGGTRRGLERPACPARRGRRGSTLASAAPLSAAGGHEVEGELADAGFDRWLLVEYAEQMVDGGGELEVVAAVLHVMVAGPCFDFDIRFDAAVLEPVADAAEKVPEFRLRGERAVHEAMARPSGDHSAPRARADQRTEAAGAKQVAEDLAVRAGVLVDERGHRPSWCLRRVRRRTAPAALLGSGASTGQPVEQQRRDVAPAVEADIHHESFAVEFGEEPAYELGVSGGEHVGHVDVAQPSARVFVHLLALPLEPVSIAGAGFVAERAHDGAARRRAVAVQRQLHVAPGLPDQQLARS